MKKVLAKTRIKTPKKESEFEMLARIVNSGFERLQTEMNERFEEVDKRFDGVDKRFEGVYSRFDLIDSQISQINYELKDHTQRLDRIEKKQFGMSENTKEMVTKSDFKDLASRVSVLEKKTAKK